MMLREIMKPRSPNTALIRLSDSTAIIEKIMREMSKDTSRASIFILDLQPPSTIKILSQHNFRQHMLA